MMMMMIVDNRPVWGVGGDWGKDRQWVRAGWAVRLPLVRDCVGFPGDWRPARPGPDGEWSCIARHRPTVVVGIGVTNNHSLDSFCLSTERTSRRCLPAICLIRCRLAQYPRTGRLSVGGGANGHLLQCFSLLFPVGSSVKPVQCILFCCGCVMWNLASHKILNKTLKTELIKCYS